MSMRAPRRHRLAAAVVALALAPAAADAADDAGTRAISGSARRSRA
jgi:hypothetical protein